MQIELGTILCACSKELGSETSKTKNNKPFTSRKICTVVNYKQYHIRLCLITYSTGKLTCFKPKDFHQPSSVNNCRTSYKERSAKFSIALQGWVQIAKSKSMKRDCCIHVFFVQSTDCQSYLLLMYNHGISKCRAFRPVCFPSNYSFFLAF